MFRVEPSPIIKSSDCTHSFWYLLNLPANCCDHGTKFHPNHDRNSNSKVFNKYQKLYAQSELLMMGGGSTRNM
jgi:hypothetical protein